MLKPFNTDLVLLQNLYIIPANFMYIKLLHIFEYSAIFREVDCRLSFIKQVMKERLGIKLVANKKSDEQKSGCY